MTKIDWPDGKRFAFTVFDDTDHTTLQNSPAIYRFLYDAGIITTKSVWPINYGSAPEVKGATCQNPAYLEWVRKLKEQGFEIALHNASYRTLKREQIASGLEQFKRYFGEYPKAQANHGFCGDSLYWGDARLSGANRLLYNLMTGFKNRGKFQGHVESSELFWGDLCKRHIKYVRNFVYPGINTLKACPYMPYFDEKRPFVNYWFASSEGGYCRAFCKTISEENQDRLEEEGGACIMYTHFSFPDFYQDGRLNPEFTRLVERLRRKSGWFVPVSRLLDHILEKRGPYTISNRERARLERRWLAKKLFVVGGSS